MKIFCTNFLLLSLMLFGGINQTVMCSINEGKKIVSSYVPKKIISNDLRFPANLLLLDSVLSHHVIVVEKSTHSLHLFQNDMGNPRYIKSYQIATGQTVGNKKNRGDNKTPEGIYRLTDFISSRKLVRQMGDVASKYGAGAFVLNYPNIMDRFALKTGGGIWLHSTNDESRIAKGLDSEGCIVVNDINLKNISQFIEIDKTPIVIVQDLYFLRKETWENNKGNLRKDIETWLYTWKNKDFKGYIGFYHKDYRDSFRKSYQAFKNYKKFIFSKVAKKHNIDISNLSILNFSDYAVVKFKQRYSKETYNSAYIHDTGLKTLYLRKDSNYQWKIVSETWKKWDENNDVAFTPSMRFFDKKDKDNKI